MSTIIDKLKDKFGNFVLPVTNTKAVYDDDGNRLDNTLNSLTEKTELFGKKLPNDTDFNSLTSSGHYSVFTNKNAPVNDGNSHTYSVIVISENNILSQMATLTFTGDLVNATYTRIYENGTWSSWVRLATSNTISDVHDSSKTYSAGQYCIYNNTLWKSKVDNNLGNTPVEGTYWTSTSIGKNLITTNGEGTYGYLGADDSFIPFKSGTNDNILFNVTDMTRFIPELSINGAYGLANCTFSGSLTYLYCNRSVNNNGQDAYMRLGHFPDLAPYSKIKVGVIVTGVRVRGANKNAGDNITCWRVMACLSTTQNKTGKALTNYDKAEYLVSDTTSNNLVGQYYEVELDVSSLSGLYYFTLNTYCWYGSSEGVTNIGFRIMKLELVE